jgi:hypothetical protein
MSEGDVARPLATALAACDVALQYTPQNSDARLHYSALRRWTRALLARDRPVALREAHGAPPAGAASGVGGVSAASGVASAADEGDAHHAAEDAAALRRVACQTPHHGDLLAWRCAPIPGVDGWSTVMDEGQYLLSHPPHTHPSHPPQAHRSQVHPSQALPPQAQVAGDAGPYLENHGTAGLSCGGAGCDDACSDSALQAVLYHPGIQEEVLKGV